MRIDDWLYAVAMICISLATLALTSLMIWVMVTGGGA